MSDTIEDTNTNKHMIENTIETVLQSQFKATGITQNRHHPGVGLEYSMSGNPIEQLTTIEKNMAFLDESLGRIITKQAEIEKLNEGFSKKTMLYSEEHKEQLKFQSSLLENEKHYLVGLKKNFLTKFAGDLHDLASDVSMLATSIITLEVGNEDRNDTMKKVATIKKTQDTNFKSMANTLTCILQNLEFIKNYLLSFDTHISSIHMKLTTENFHCHNIESHIIHKRKQIGIEYERYLKTLDLHLTYYLNLSIHIAEQMPHMKLLLFCISGSGSE